MKKITAKIKAGTSQQEAEMLIKALWSAFPEADIDVIYSDDPALSVVLAEKTERDDALYVTKVAPSSNELNPHSRPDGGVYGRD